MLLSIAVYYFYLGKTQATQRRETTRQALYFGSGVLLILLPVLLRNYLLFDALNPYQMEPSTVSFIHNVRTFTQEISYDLSGLRALGVLTGWSSLGAILIAGAVASAAWVYKAEWRRLTPTRTNAVFLCATYIVLGASIVIAARTRYEWGEMINVRHTLQYTPFLWVVLLGLLPDNLSRWRTPVTLAVILLLLTSSLHLVYATVPRDLQLFNQRGLMAVAAFRNGKHFLCQSENETLTVSNWGYVFRIECDTPTRTLEMKKFQCPSSATETLPCAAHGGEIITKTLLQTSAQRAGEPIKLGFFAGRGIPPQRLALSENELAGLEHAGFHVVRNDERGTLLSRHITH